jgi:uncharacterized protein with HEPN domain
MRQAAGEICEFVKGMDYARFESNKVVRYAVERQLLVIGEAARGISDKLRKANPQLPWSAIIGQRNVLAHDYGEILTERVWRVATDNIPKAHRAARCPDAGGAAIVGYVRLMRTG